MIMGSGPMLRYPLAWLDRLLSGSSPGCEVLVVARVAERGRREGMRGAVVRLDELLEVAATGGVVVAPRPDPVRVRSGWLSRVAAVERLMAEAGTEEALPRLYVDPLHRDDHCPEARVRLERDGVVEVAVDPRWGRQHALLRELVGRARWVYVHTVSLARYVVPFMDSGRVLVDVHGIAPEEEVLHGRPVAAGFFEQVERRVWRDAAAVLTVTEAMREHLDAKHGPGANRRIVLPIFLEGAPRPRPASASPSPRPTVIYAGGLQDWQCVDDMLELVSAVGTRARFVFLSQDADVLRGRLARRGLAGLVEVCAVGKDEVPAWLAGADYGLVVRDDGPVNRVACPTKLVEYLAHGLVPIVKSTVLGDFPRYGYRTLALADVAAGRFPDAVELEAIRRANDGALQRLGVARDEGRAELLSWLREGAAVPRSRPEAWPRLELLSPAELASGATSLAEVVEIRASGPSSRTIVEFPTWEPSARLRLSGLPLREVRFRPVRGPFVARVHGAAFGAGHGSSVTPAVVVCRGRRSFGAVAVAATDCPGYVALRPVPGNAGPFTELTVWLDVVAEGPEVGPPGVRWRLGREGLVTSRPRISLRDLAARAWRWLRGRLGR